MSAFSAWLIGIFMLLSQSVFADSFATQARSVSRLGNAFAGSGAFAEDASIGYDNPAGLTDLKVNHFVISTVYNRFRPTLFNSIATDDLGNAVTGDSSSRAYNKYLVPGLHAAWIFTDKISFSLNVNEPYAINSRNNQLSMARFMSTLTKINTVNISPAIGYKYTDLWSFGFGYDAMFTKIKFRSNRNNGILGRVDNEGDAWTHGFHVGVMAHLSDYTTLGFTYHSGFSVNISGDTYQENFNSAYSNFETTIKLPERLNYSVYHKYSDRWSALGTFEWSHWSKFKTLILTYNTGAQDKENHFPRNSWRLSFGSNYTISDEWILKSGFAFSKSSVRDAFRTARAPDSDHFWISFGLKYTYLKRLSVDIAYSRLIFKKSDIAERIVTDQRTLFGNYKNSADLVGVQLVWNFV